MQKTQEIYALTGSTGFLGRYLLKDLIKRFPDAQGVLLLNRTAPVFIPEGWKTYSASLNNDEALSHALRGVTTLIHLAGLTHANSSKEYWTANALGTRNLVEAAKKNTVSRIIYVSTRAISDECGDYAKSKHQGELYIINSQIPFVILRHSEIYGVESNEGINGLVSLVRKSPIIPYPSGASLFAPLFLEDAIGGILACLERDDNINNRIYTLAGPKSYTFVELIRVISKVLGLRRMILPLPQIFFIILMTLGKKIRRPFLRYDQLARMVCPKDDDINPAKRDLGFQPRPFENGLKNLI